MGMIWGALAEWTEKLYGYGYGYGYGSGSGSGYGSGSGDGDGDGDGSGSGYGYGYGSGSGDGDGDGYGSGSGYGYGYGSGSGDGDGSGSGSGSGYGYGYGSGDGDGDGSGSLLHIFQATVALWEENSRDRLASIVQGDCFLAFWRSDKKGFPANSGKSPTPAAPGKVEEIPGPLKICTRNGLHATLNPSKWKGERMWVVALYGEIQRDADKVAALKREIIGEVPQSFIPH